MSVNKFIDGKLRMVAGLTPGGGGAGGFAGRLGVSGMLLRRKEPSDWGI